MKVKLLFSVLTTLIFSSCAFSAINDPPQEINLADPTIFLHNETYYLYGTVEGNVNTGFLVYTSQDMKSWQKPAGVEGGFALHKKDVYGDKGFWAPQVFVHKGKFYMAYTANENIAIAESDSPLGPFKQKVKAPIRASVKQIDPFVFTDDNGKHYLYHVRLENGNRIYVAEMTDDFHGIKEETLTECITAKEPWENTENVSWPVAEGPSVLKRNDLYYLVYSANDFRNIDYAVGYAVSDKPEGPWRKHERNPILDRKKLGINGVGHGDFLQYKKGELVYVFHTHQSDIAVAPRKTALIDAHFRNGQLEMDFKSSFFPGVEEE